MRWKNIQLTHVTNFVVRSPMQHVTYDASDVIRRARELRESVFVASWVHMAHGNVNSVAPNNNPPRESKRRATAHTAFYPKYNVSFKTHGYSRFHTRALRSHPLRLSFVRSLADFFLFFTLVVVHQFYNCSEYALWFSTQSTRIAVCALHALSASTVCDSPCSIPGRLKINNIVQFEIKCSETVQ